MFLREDVVAYMLYFNRTHHQQHTLIVENTHGFLTGSLLLQHGGFGSITHIHVGKHPNIHLLHHFNASPELLHVLRYTQLSKLHTNLRAHSLLLCTMHDP
uniref:tRNA (adenine(58)-N(1))-methyltransferase non-catalytic subunit TRM6 n=1 Tax=Lygus hesperus TaxID=30085 RepID=A0A0A9YEA5_LYGHE